MKLKPFTLAVTYWIAIIIIAHFASGQDLAVSAVTTGGREAAYQHDGYNRFTIRELLAPLEQTTRLCGMQFLPPFVVHGKHRLDQADIDRAAAEYRRAIEALRDDRLDLDAVASQTRLNARLDAVIRP